MTVKRNWLIVGGVLVALVVLPVAWFLVSPLFITRAVDEPPPVPLGTSAVAAPPAAEATDAMATAMLEPTTPVDEPMPAAMPAEPVVLAQGQFYAVAHEGHGTATIYELVDGSRALRLDDFMVLNGPDLHVYLVPVDPVPNQVGVEIPGYVDLGQLKGNVGSQNYTLSPALDLSQFKSVVIWCQPFRVPFIAAPLQ